MARARDGGHTAARGPIRRAVLRAGRAPCGLERGGAGEAQGPGGNVVGAPGIGHSVRRPAGDQASGSPVQVARAASGNPPTPDSLDARATPPTQLSSGSSVLSSSEVDEELGKLKTLVAAQAKVSRASSVLRGACERAGPYAVLACACPAHLDLPHFPPSTHPHARSRWRRRGQMRPGQTPRRGACAPRSSAWSR